MQLGEKIKIYRIQYQLSQEDLAELLDTSRQTISSWENDKTYPGMLAVVSLSEIFQIPVETLIKEDVVEMKEILDNKAERIQRNKDRDMMNRMAALRTGAVFIGGVSAYPVYHYHGWLYALIPILILAMGMLTTIPIEHYLRKYNLKKYQDIVTFFDEKYDRP